MNMWISNSHGGGAGGAQKLETRSVCVCVCVPDMIGMLSSCCGLEHAPEEWNIVLIFPILHEGRQNSENYRGCKLGECHIQKNI
jgi:hypothetical protein